MKTHQLFMSILGLAALTTSAAAGGPTGYGRRDGTAGNTFNGQNVAPAVGTMAMDSTPFGPSGCGLGSVIMGPSPGIMQSSAVYTNLSLINQSFGITSGTWNCGYKQAGVMAAKQFIQTNRQAFAKDVSRGSGETLDSIASIAGCPDHRAVAVALQKNFRGIFPHSNVNSSQISAAAIATLRADKQLSCSRLI